MKKFIAATAVAVALTAGGMSSAGAAETHHAGHFSPYYYVTHKHGHKVYVDISGNGWKSKRDAVHESKRLLRWLKSIGY